MMFFMFSPDGKNFCQFMTPNFPKPMFLPHFHPGLVGTLTFLFPKTDIWALGPGGPPKAWPSGPFGAHLTPGGDLNPGLAWIWTKFPFTNSVIWAPELLMLMYPPEEAFLVNNKPPVNQ